jgi:folate-dependent phosphoribosylglycinamide formyltransferase PurN
LSERRTLLICHGEEALHADGVARWLAAHSTLAGIVKIHDSRDVKLRRLRRELARSGIIGVLDVLAFRLFYWVRRASRDSVWAREALQRLQQTYAPVPASVAVINVNSPNSPQVEEFIRLACPDVTVALCKHMLRESIFALPRSGTFVFHPGICPEYRNAHGCFWALATGDLERVGLSVLKVDRGIDSGPVYGYFTSPIDETSDSHIVMQTRLVVENLERIWELLASVMDGSALPLPVDGRSSRVWGQPRLSSYISWRRDLGRRHALRRP